MSQCIECSICCDEIGSSRATLACSHTFHLGCIGKWILKNETCPMCRREMDEKERIAEPVEDDEEEDDEEWDGEEEEDDEEDDDRTLHWRRVGENRWIVEKNPLVIPHYDEEAHALWVMRKTFEMAEDGASISAEGVQPKLEEFDTLESVAERYDGMGGFILASRRMTKEELRRPRRESF